MIKHVFIALFCLFNIDKTSAHDIHVSVCDIEINGDKLDITFKTFLDDLQLALGLTPGEELPKTYSSAEKMIEEYLNQQLEILLNGKPMSLQIERADGSSYNAVWVTLKQVKIDEPIKSIVIKNKFLTELYKDQTNLVQLKMNEEKSMIQLNKKNKTHEFSF